VNNNIDNPELSPIRSVKGDAILSLQYCPIPSVEESVWSRKRLEDNNKTIASTDCLFDSIVLTRIQDQNRSEGSKGKSNRRRYRCSPMTPSKSFWSNSYDDNGMMLMPRLFGEMRCGGSPGGKKGC
jgi:hypothetical protein